MPDLADQLEKLRKELEELKNAKNDNHPDVIYSLEKRARKLHFESTGSNLKVYVEKLLDEVIQLRKKADEEARAEDIADNLKRARTLVYTVAPLKKVSENTMLCQASS